MRIQLIAIGSTGDVLPMVTLGQELVRRGHAVSIAAFDGLRPLVESSGLGFVALPGDAERFIGSIIRPGASPVTYLSRLQGALRAVAGPLLDALLAACAGADVVAHGFFGGVIDDIAGELGIPVLEVCYCPMRESGDYSLPILRPVPLGRVYNRATHRLASRMIRGVEARYVDPWRAERGIGTRRGAVSQTLYAYSPLVAPRPAEWPDTEHVTGYWFEPETAWESEAAFEPPASLTSFLSAGDAPVYIGFGSMTAGDMDGLLSATLDALRETGLRAVLASGWSGLDSAALPDNAYLVHGHVPHRWLFARVRALVHHGGAGTTGMGLTAGKPSLLVPFGGDQHFWADRVYRLGCGPKPIPRARLTAAVLARGLAALAETPAYARNAEALGARLQRECGAQRAADLIEAAGEQRE